MGNKTGNPAFKSNFFSLNNRNMSFEADLSVKLINLIFKLTGLQLKFLKEK